MELIVSNPKGRRDDVSTQHAFLHRLLDACHQRANFAAQPLVYIALGLPCRRVSSTRNPFDQANHAVRSRSEEGL